ncbi:MAG: hypothetical protein ACKPKO_15565, partial [Candidatus Fonsibacter sp.]
QKAKLGWLTCRQRGLIAVGGLGCNTFLGNSLQRAAWSAAPYRRGLVQYESPPPAGGGSRGCGWARALQA